VLTSKTADAIVPSGVGPVSWTSTELPGATLIWPPLTSPISWCCGSKSDPRTLIVMELGAVE
jgi:hypothetical protein